MTVIVYLDGQCWADDLLHLDGGNVCGRMIKISYRPKDKAIMAAAGSSVGIYTFLRLAEAGKEKEYKHDCDNTTAVIFHVDGRIQYWENGAHDEFRADHFAIGSGRMVAIGAMIAGATARGACLAACQAMGWQACLHGVNHEGEWSTTDTTGFIPQIKSKESLNGIIKSRNRGKEKRKRSPRKKR